MLEWFIHLSSNFEYNSVGNLDTTFSQRRSEMVNCMVPRGTLWFLQADIKSNDCQFHYYFFISQ